MTYQFTPSSWNNGAQSLDGTAQEFASSANAILGRLMNVADAVPMASTQADVAVAQILMSIGTAGQQTVAGIARGLGSEAGIMRDTGDAYERCETSNESLASKVGR
ncbi:MAG: hypothetical protein E7L00_04070 [Propionibacteriaceae bacterium]|nr:hypothetical protein [Propionibacteriaceae bacterium]